MKTAAKQQKEVPARRACILHAEDDRFTSMSIARLLTLKGFKVESATDGLDALTKLLAQPEAYDLIITDQSMPSLTGVEWLQGIRDTGFSGKIIVFASSLPGEAAGRFHQLGVERILSKSGSLQSLLDAIEELLNKAAPKENEATQFQIEGVASILVRGGSFLQRGSPPPPPWRPVRAPYGFTVGKERNLEPMKAILLLALPCLTLALCGCGSTSSYRTTRRGPVWVVPATASVSSTPSSVTVAATNSPPKVETNRVPARPATANAPLLRTNTPPSVANALSVTDIKELAGKGVSEQTILNVLCASRAIYTLTTQDVTELQEAKVSRAVIDYLLSTPLLYKDDLLRSRAYYYYTPLYPSYWHWSFHDFHHDVHHCDSHYSYGHDSHHGGVHH